jgi:hypothetical protein
MSLSAQHSATLLAPIYSIPIAIRNSEELAILNSSERGSQVVLGQHNLEVAKPRAGVAGRLPRSTGLLAPPKI